MFTMLNVLWLFLGCIDYCITDVRSVCQSVAQLISVSLYGVNRFSICLITLASCLLLAYIIVFFTGY